MQMLQQYIEAMIFASERPTAVKELQESLQTAFEWELNTEQVEEALEALKAKYMADEFSFELVQSGGGYQFLTKKDYAPLITTFLNIRSRKRLSSAALETLAIVAYKQPITKAEVEQIRGVSCDYTLQKLLEKELLVVGGRADAPGKPLLYATSETFMDYFGINSPADLPKLKEIEQQEKNSIGEQQDIDEAAKEEISNE